MFPSRYYVEYPLAVEPKPGPLFAKRTDVLPLDLAKCGSREIRV